MSKQEERGTRERILESSRKLFAEKGFYGTSVREISEAADVNVAAINYHFKSKETLVFEVLKDGYGTVSEKINALKCGEKENVADFGLKIFRTLVEHRNITLNTMKIMLSVDASKMEAYGFCDEELGPPGANRLLEVLQEKLPKKLSQKDCLWYVHTVFSLLFHKAIMLVSPYAQKPSIRKIIEASDVEGSLHRTMSLMFRELEDSMS